MELIERLRQERVVAIDAAELAELLAAARATRVEDTGSSGPIRVLACGDEIAVQEQTPGGEILVRLMPSQSEADRFVDDRLAVYERMWNGCGCRIDYHRS